MEWEVLYFRLRKLWWGLGFFVCEIQIHSSIDLTHSFIRSIICSCWNVPRSIPRVMKWKYSQWCKMKLKTNHTNSVRHNCEQQLCNLPVFRANTFEVVAALCDLRKCHWLALGYSNRQSFRGVHIWFLAGSPNSFNSGKMNDVLDAELWLIWKLLPLSRQDEILRHSGVKTVFCNRNTKIKGPYLEI